jgi:hypothetical protein
VLLAALVVGNERDRQVFEVRVGIGDGLVAVAVYRLLEVALPVDQPDADEG